MINHTPVSAGDGIVAALISQMYDIPLGSLAKSAVALLRNRPSHRTPIPKRELPALTEVNYLVGGLACPYSSFPQQETEPLSVNPQL